VVWATVSKKLGVAARKAWPYLCALRDASVEGRKLGQVWISAEGLAKHLGWKPRKAELCITRLRSVGLLKPVGWQCRKRHQRDIFVYVRRVFGDARIVDDRVSMPKASVAALLKLGSGGARIGAGRPRKGVGSGIQTGGSRNSNRGDNSILRIEANQNLISLRDIDCGSQGTAVLQSTSKQPDECISSSGTTFKGGGDGYRPTELPPFPSFSVVQPAIVPNPPLLDSTLSEDAQVEMLAAVYRSVVAAKLNRPTRHATVRKDVRAKLVDACKLLIEHEISPIAWAAFSFDEWKAATGKSTQPLLGWVWSSSRLDTPQRRGFFRSSTEIAGGRLIFGPIYKKLLDTWYAALHEARRTHDARAATEHFFPDGEYDRLVEAARAEAEDNQKRMRAMSERGDWLW
jgi:hypothetical protein